jgi:hypothetical protein
MPSFSGCGDASHKTKLKESHAVQKNVTTNFIWPANFSLRGNDTTHFLKSVNVRFGPLLDAQARPMESVVCMRLSGGQA